MGWSWPVRHLCLASRMPGLPLVNAGVTLMTNRTCLRCGSDKVIPNIPLFDKFGEFGALSKPIEVEVHGSPTAWLFRDTEAGELVAFICGDCGHTELKAKGFSKLYQKYLESQDRTPPTTSERFVVCLACGQSIPKDLSCCPNCAWTWEDTDEA